MTEITHTKTRYQIVDIIFTDNPFDDVHKHASQKFGRRLRRTSEISTQELSEFYQQYIDTYRGGREHE